MNAAVLPLPRPTRVVWMSFIRPSQQKLCSCPTPCLEALPQRAEEQNMLLLPGPPAPGKETVYSGENLAKPSLQ